MAEDSQAWVKLYHPAGVDVRLPIPIGMGAIDVAAWRAVLDSVTNALEAGFTVDAPGLEAGETKETASAVVHSNHDNRDGTFTPVVDLYVGDDRYKRLKVYLNSPELVEQFETAAGVKLHALPVYVGSGDIERGKNRQLDQFVAPVKPFNFVHKPNPKHDPNETDPAKKRPKRVFVRFNGSPAPASTPQQPAAGGQQQPPANGKPQGDDDLPADGFALLTRLREFGAKCVADGVSRTPAEVVDHVIRTLGSKAYPNDPAKWDRRAIILGVDTAKAYYKVHRPAQQQPGKPNPVKPADVMAAGLDHFGDTGTGFDEWLVSQGIPDAKILGMLNPPALSDLWDKLAALRAAALARGSKR